MKDRLKVKGIYNLRDVCNSLDLDYGLIAEELQSRLGRDERIIDPCGIIVSMRWIELMKGHVKESGRVIVSDFARKQDVEMRTAVCLLRNLLKGVYVSSSDTYFAKA